MKKKQKDTPIVLKIIFVLIIVAQAFASTLFLSALAKLNLLQNWQFYIVVGVLVLFLLLNAYKLLVSRRAGTAAKIICALLAILISGAAILGFKYVQQMVSFVENITGLHYETTTYQVRTLKNGNYKDVSQLARQHVGFLSTNPNLDNTKNTLRNIVDYKDTDYEEIGSMLAALYDYEVAAVVINQSYLDFLEEAESTFEADTVVLQEFEVRTEAPDTHESAVDVTVEPFILYISGSDSRGSIKQVSRSDVNIVAVVNPKTAKILLISIPRDYYVQLHGTTGTKDKLTHAGVYGIEKSKTTIEDLLGIKINYTVKVGFQTVIRIVDAIDGIEIDSDLAFKRGDCNFIKGKQTVNSACALTFSRERKSYTTGDRHRGENQQQVLTKIIEKVTTPHYLVRYSKILDAAEGTFETSMSYDEITGFVRHQLNDMRAWSVESIQLDGTGSLQPTYSMGARKLYVMIPDQSTIVAAQKKITEYLGNQ